MDNIEENKNHFMGYDFTMKHGGIDESRYKNVFYGDIEANNLEDIYENLMQGISLLHIWDIRFRYQM